jgi:hypothetical protein
MHLTRDKRVKNRLCARQPPLEHHDREKKKRKRIRNEPHVRDVPVKVAVMCEPVEGPLWSGMLRARTKSVFANLCREWWDE